METDSHDRILKPSVVAAIRCTSYDPAEVQEAIDRGLEWLGGARAIVDPNERVLLKPNLLLGRSPEQAVTTHPSVFRAVAMAFRSSGVQSISYGDSPGFGRTEAAAQRAGLVTVAQELGVELADFSRGETVSFPDGKQNKQFTIARGVLEADAIVSLPKMKTHGLTRITGAIKNQFGCVPGPLKAEFHARLPRVDLFSQMLVDLTRLLRPRLFVMDGIVAMEGNGPGNGSPCAMNVLLLSSDPVALDTTVCRLIGLEPKLVPPIQYGVAFGLGASQDIEYVGDPIDGLVNRSFAVNRQPAANPQRPGRLSRLVRKFVVPRPVVRTARCTRCGTCVQVCPVTPKAIEFRSAGRTEPPIHDYGRCIRCYCCQELCPEGAIEISTPVLGRLIHRRT